MRRYKLEKICSDRHSQNSSFSLYFKKKIILKNRGLSTQGKSRDLNENSNFQKQLKLKPIQPVHMLKAPLSVHYQDSDYLKIILD